MGGDSNVGIRIRRVGVIGLIRVVGVDFMVISQSTHAFEGASLVRCYSSTRVHLILPLLPLTHHHNGVPNGGNSKGVGARIDSTKDVYTSRSTCAQHRAHAIGEWLVRDGVIRPCCHTAVHAGHTPHLHMTETFLYPLIWSAGVPSLGLRRRMVPERGVVLSHRF